LLYWVDCYIPINKAKQSKVDFSSKDNSYNVHYFVPTIGTVPGSGEIYSCVYTQLYFSEFWGLGLRSC
jgi:hypothetical protein